MYAQIRGQVLETDGTPVFNINDNRNYSYDQKGYSAKFGIEKERYATSLDYSQNSGNVQYSNWGAFSSQDFENEIVNLKGRINPTQTTEINARLSQFKDDLDQVTSSSFVHSTTQEAEIYGKWNFTAAQNVLLGITQRNTDAKPRLLMKTLIQQATIFSTSIRQIA